MLGVNLTNGNPLERLKRSLQEQSLCPPGIWTCVTEKREEMVSQPQKSIAHAVPVNSHQTSHLCPPGIWTCLESSEPVADKMIDNSESDNSALAGGLGQAEKENKSQPVESGNEGQTENRELDNGSRDCPPGIWVCQRKRLFRKMKKQPSKVMKQPKERVGRSAQKCPPGIWVC